MLYCRWMSKEGIRGDILETIIWPEQGRIRIPKQYYKDNKKEFNLKAPGMLRNDEEITITTHFGKDDVGVYMTPGVRVAKVFGCEVPTRVRLDYDGAKNFFRLTPLGNILVPNVFPTRVKEEPIQIVSDNEMEEEEDEDEDETVEEDETEEEEEAEHEEEEPENLNFYHFEKTVTKALASIKKLQVLHFPNSVSRKVLKKRYLRMPMEDVETRKTYQCWVRTAPRKNHEKSLGGGWFQFVVDRGLKVNDKLLFQLEDPPKKMYVRHIRHQ
ncbi:uncharacterized protein [Medicago truncatula]|uniref:uncharacterized protein n=1 Tax=Medicago truncatula TaxID=3880 RepID=UPI00196786AB|nr:uncharacterized protein LOC120580491 [Medicago truncatula]